MTPNSEFPPLPIERVRDLQDPTRHGEWVVALALECAAARIDLAASAERIDTLTNECAMQRGIISECKEMLAARAQRIERLETALRSVEWGGTSYPYTGADGVVYCLCPLCDQVEPKGHAPDCLVGMALAQEGA